MYLRFQPVEMTPGFCNSTVRFSYAPNYYLDDETYRVLVATDGRVLAGYTVAIVQEYPPIRTIENFGFIQEIAVARQFRRKGIARQLFESAEVWLIAKGVPQVEVKIDIANEASQALFESEGFVRHTETLIKKLKDA